MNQSEINDLVGKKVTARVELVGIPAGTAGRVIKVPPGQCYKPNFPLVSFANGIKRVVSPNALIVCDQENKS